MQKAKNFLHKQIEFFKTSVQEHKGVEHVKIILFKITDHFMPSDFMISYCRIQIKVGIKFFFVLSKEGFGLIFTTACSALHFTTVHFLIAFRKGNIPNHGIIIKLMIRFPSSSTLGLAV